MPNSSLQMMKSVALFLIGVCCYASGHSQNVFYDEDRPIKIQSNLESKVVHFDNHELFELFVASPPEGVELVRLIDKYSAVVVEIENNSNPELVLSDQFNVQGIKNETFSFELEDGFEL